MGQKPEEFAFGMGDIQCFAHRARPITKSPPDPSEDFREFNSQRHLRRSVTYGHRHLYL